MTVATLGKYSRPAWAGPVGAIMVYGSMALSTVAAFWGAGLSTLLALVKLLPDRPIFHVEPGVAPEGDLQLRIVNPSSRMAVIRDWRRFRVAGPDDAIGIYTPGRTTLIEAGQPGTFVLALSAGGEQRVTVNCLSGEAKWLVVFLWRHTWLLPIWLPSIVYLSGQDAEIMKRSAID